MICLQLPHNFSWYSPERWNFYHFFNRFLNFFAWPWLKNSMVLLRVKMPYWHNLLGGVLLQFQLQKLFQIFKSQRGAIPGMFGKYFVQLSEQVWKKNVWQICQCVSSSQRVCIFCPLRKFRKICFKVFCSYRMEKDLDNFGTVGTIQGYALIFGKE